MCRNSFLLSEIDISTLLFYILQSNLNYHNFLSTEPNGDGDRILLSGPGSIFGHQVTGKWHDYVGSYDKQSSVCIKRTTRHQREALKITKESDSQLAHLKIARLESDAYKALLSDVDGDDEDENSGTRIAKRRGRGGSFKSPPPIHPSKKKMFQNAKGQWVCPNLWHTDI